MKKLLAHTLLFLLPAFANATENKVDLGLDLHSFSIVQRNFAITPTVLQPNPPRRVEGYQFLSLRLKGKAELAEQVLLEAHLVQEILLRSFEQGVEFDGYSIRGVAPLFVIDDLKVDEVDEPALLMSLYPDRGVMSWSGEKLNFAVGRQTASFGKTFFWNPLDWLTPFTPTTLDRTYKPGADLARVDYWFTPMFSGSLFYAFGDAADWHESALLGSFAIGLEGYDIDLLVGKIKDDLRFGAGFSATAPFLGGGALRGELAAYLPTDDYDASFMRATLSYDYQFLNSLQVVGEYHFNGVGASDTNDYLVVIVDPHFASGEITSLAQHYMAGRLSYEWSALFKPEFSALFNLVDGSLVLAPGFAYSLANEVDLRLSSFLPIGAHPDALGSPSTEFGLYPTNVSLELAATF